MCPTKMENLIVWWENHEMCNFPMFLPHLSSPWHCGITNQNKIDF